MVRKTKKQKMRIQMHKQQLTSPSPIISKKEKEAPIPDVYKQETTYVLKDLKKTGIITAIILCLEFLVFYATLRGVTF